MVLYGWSCAEVQQAHVLEADSLRPGGCREDSSRGGGEQSMESWEHAPPSSDSLIIPCQGSNHLLEGKSRHFTGGGFD